MPHIRTSRPWTTQPGYAARLRPERHIKMLLIPLGSGVYDLVERRWWAAGGNAKTGVNGGDRVAQFDGVDDAYSITGGPQVVGNRGTCFAWVRRIGSTYDSNGSILLGTNTGSSVFFQLNRAGATNQIWSFGSASFNGSTDLRGATNRALCFSSDQVTQRFYVNGVLDASLASAGTAFPAGNKSFEFGGWPGGSSWDCDMDIAVLGFTTQPWLAEEARAFYADPWNFLFEPEPIQVYWVAAGGGQTIIPSGIASTLAFGTAKLNRSIVASDIASTVAFGTAKLNRSIIASGIASTVAFGTAKLNRSIIASGIASGAAFGAPAIALDQTIIVSGIANTTSLGTPTITVAGGAQTITASGIASTLAFGTQRVNLKVVPSGISSTLTLGAPRINRNIVLSGIASGLSFGSAIATGGAAQAVASPTVWRLAAEDRTWRLAAEDRTWRLAAEDRTWRLAA